MEPKGIILYAEDLDILDRMLDPAEAFAVVMALNRYAMDGEIPTGLSAAQMIAFEMIRQKIDRAMQNYAAKSEKRSAAAKSRWDAKASNAMQTDAKNANASFAEQPMQMDGTVTVTETVNVTETKAEGVVNTPAPAPDDDRILAFDGSDLSQASADNEQAQRLVARYMPASKTPIEFDPRVADISDLIAQYGLKTVDDTMKEAMRSDNRGGISVNFIKAIIEGKGSKARAAPGGDYQRRQYDDNYWKSIEQHFDDAI